MDEQKQTDADNCIAENLESVLSQLTIDQIRFVVARQECATDREAARMVGLSESTVYRWPDIVKRAVKLMFEDGLVTALHLRRRNLAKAMAVKVKGLDSDSERLRQRVSTEIIEWELGTATHNEKIDGSVTVYKGYKTVSPDDWDDDNE